MLSFSFGGKIGYYANAYYIGDENIILYASICGYTNQIDYLLRQVKHKGEITFSYCSKGKINHLDDYYVKKYIDHATDLAHIILLKKEVIKNEDTIFYIADTSIPSTSLLYDKVDTFSAIPLKPEWGEVLKEGLLRYGCIDENRMTTYHTSSHGLKLYICKINDLQIKNIIIRGLGNDLINITPEARNSVLTSEMRLDQYLINYAETLAYRIKNSFKPRYDPITQQLSTSVNDFEDWCYNMGKGISMFDAQSSVIEAAKRCLSKEHIALIIGECGVGKTKLGAGITYSHGNQLGYNAVIMCPAHLVHKWSREILESVPNSRCVIVNHIKDVVKLENEINNRNKTYNLYMIMSFGTAKFTYEKVPCANFKSIYLLKESSTDKEKITGQYKDVFVCPKCGTPLKKKVKISSGNCARYEWINLTDSDFKKENKDNKTCQAEIKIYDPASNKTKKIVCGEPLWQPINKEEVATDWVKVADKGWYRLDRIDPLYEYYVNCGHLTADEKELTAKLSKVKEALEDNQTFNVRGARKYSVAEYLKKHFKKKIDYAVFDEMHMLSKQSMQGKAMSDLVCASRNVIGLTGTLINGYADSLFDIFYRIIPRKMIEHGFAYDKRSKFLKTYGSIKTTIDAHDKRNAKPQPGVSPLLFTEYLLDICAFIDLNDVAEGLPGYEEVPIAIKVDQEVRLKYDAIVESFKDEVGYKRENSRCCTTYMQLMTTYPDMPYNQPPIVNKQTGKTVFVPEYCPNAIDYKLDRCVALVKERHALGEKVLIYYSWTDITDVKEKLQKALVKEGLKVGMLTSDSGYFNNKTKKIKNVDREEWLNDVVEEGLEVLLCNPTLVETGLDLLAFTSIIFYQLDYDIYTMRQASKRSYRLSQVNDVKVYFLYYAETLQEDILSLMATKLQASCAAEGKVSEEGLSALSQSGDLTSQLTKNVVKGVSSKVDIASFNRSKRISNSGNLLRHLNRNRKTRNQLTYKKPIVLPWLSFGKNRERKSLSDPIIFDLFRKSAANF